MSRTRISGELAGAVPAGRAGAWANDAAYAGIIAPLTIVYLPTVSILPALYSKEAGLSLVVLGTILMVMRIVDAVVDPFIGYWSDRLRGLPGGRKPWILIGAVLASLGALVLFSPTATSGYVQFTLGYLLLVVGYSLVEIPHLAWINELSGEYQRRNRLSTWRYVAGWGGGALFLAIPLLGIFPTTEMSAQVTAAGVWLVIGLFLVTLPPLMRMPHQQTVTAAEASSVMSVVRALRGNRPLWLLLAIQASAWLASGIVAGLFFFYLGTYLQIASKYSHIMLTVYVVSIVGSLFWLQLTTRIDKHRLVAMCCVVVAACNVAMFFIPPGEWAMYAMIGVFTVTAFAVAGKRPAVTAMIADIADYSALRSGEDHAGNYAAAHAFLSKCAEAVGGGLGLVIAGLFGFSAKGPNDATAMAGFFLAIVWIPCALNLLGAVLAWRFPIDRRRHAIIRRRLETRAARATIARAPA